MEIYLDNSATTAPSSAAKTAMLEAMDVFGNPSSLHEKGQASAALLRRARSCVGEALGERFLKEGQLIFTASGTEANSLAILGAAHAKSRRAAGTVLTTDSEHPSVARNLEQLEREGFRVVRIPTRGGAPDMEAVYNAATRDLFMVSVMLVNNETGAVYPVREVFAAAHAANPDCICHCDAVQGFLKVPFAPRTLGADLMTVSAHKIHGPKGVGALWVAPRLLTSRSLASIYGGGGQEWGFRSGTENVIGIAGFAAAVAEKKDTWQGEAREMRALTDSLIAALEGSEIRCNLPAVRAPHIVNITLPDIKSETMLHYLSGKGIFVSAGSACSAHAKAPSGALLAFGLAREEADCSLRISLSGMNTKGDVEALVSALFEGVESLVRIHRKPIVK